MCVCVFIYANAFISCTFTLNTMYVRVSLLMSMVQACLEFYQ